MDHSSEGGSYAIMVQRGMDIMKYLWKILPITTLAVTLVLPAVAEDKTLNDKAKNVRKSGLYGKSSWEGDKKPSQNSKTNKPQSLKAKKQKYDLSITPHTEAIQSAHQHLLKGAQLFGLSKTIFKEAYSVSSKIDKKLNTLNIKYKALLKTTPTVDDVKRYGLSKAFLAVRLRGLQTASRTLARSIGHVNEASRLSPGNVHIQKWQKSLRNMQKIIKFHIEFNKIVLRADNLGLTEVHLARLANMWDIDKDVKPSTTLVKEFGLPSDMGEKNAKKSVGTSSKQRELPDIEKPVKKNK